MSFLDTLDNVAKEFENLATKAEIAKVEKDIEKIEREIDELKSEQANDELTACEKKAVRQQLLSCRSEKASLQKQKASWVELYSLRQKNHQKRETHKCTDPKVGRKESQQQPSVDVTDTTKTLEESVEKWSSERDFPSPSKLINSKRKLWPTIPDENVILIRRERNQPGMLELIDGGARVVHKDAVISHIDQEGLEALCKLATKDFISCLQVLQKRKDQPLYSGDVYLILIHDIVTGGGFFSPESVAWESYYLALWRVEREHTYEFCGRHFADIFEETINHVGPFEVTNRTVQEVKEMLEKEGATFEDFSPDDVMSERVICCRRWLAEQSKQQTVNKRISTYGLKHRVEDYRKRLGSPMYVCNNAMKIALCIAGYKLYFIDDLNWHANIKLSNVR